MSYKYLSLFFLLTFASCDTSAITDAVNQVESAKKSLKEAKKTFKEVKGAAKNISKLAKSAEDLEKSTERLSKLDPVSKKTIKAWMPEELDGMKRTKFTVATKMGVADISNVKLTFENKPQKKKVEVQIVDGAGSGVSILSPFFMAQNMEIDVENEKGYQRTEKRDGNNVLIEYSNPPHEKTSMKYVLEGRFLVEIKAKDMNPDALWALNNKLKIIKLQD